jgi:hypothetical protein
MLDCLVLAGRQEHRGPKDSGEATCFILQPCPAERTEPNFQREAI